MHAVRASRMLPAAAGPVSEVQRLRPSSSTSRAPSSTSSGSGRGVGRDKGDEVRLVF